jgi:hypothetical protein
MIEDFLPCLNCGGQVKNGGAFCDSVCESAWGSVLQISMREKVGRFLQDLERAAEVEKQHVSVTQ